MANRLRNAKSKLKPAAPVGNKPPLGPSMANRLRNAKSKLKPAAPVGKVTNSILQNAKKNKGGGAGGFAGMLAKKKNTLRKTGLNATKNLGKKPSPFGVQLRKTGLNATKNLSKKPSPFGVQLRKTGLNATKNLSKKPSPFGVQLRKTGLNATKNLSKKPSPFGVQLRKTGLNATKNLGKFGRNRSMAAAARGRGANKSAQAGLRPTGPSAARKSWTGAGSKIQAGRRMQNAGRMQRPGGAFGAPLRKTGLNATKNLGKFGRNRSMAAAARGRGVNKSAQAGLRPTGPSAARKSWAGAGSKIQAGRRMQRPGGAVARRPVPQRSGGSELERALARRRQGGGVRNSVRAGRRGRR